MELKLIGGGLDATYIYGCILVSFHKAFFSKHVEISAKHTGFEASENCKDSFFFFLKQVGKDLNLETSAQSLLYVVCFVHKQDREMFMWKSCFPCTTLYRNVVREASKAPHWHDSPRS